jgi:N-acetylglucosaminyl-diphospho-decaprenol L-rhamnosyltransferase
MCAGEADAGRAVSREPAVTVTTVLYNSEAVLERYAAAIAPALEQGLVRVIAVDNASPDASLARLERLLPGAETIASAENVGFAGGCNLAWPEVRSRYWLLLNPDVEADAQGIERLVSWMDDHPEVGLASPRLRGPDGEEMPVARAQDSLLRPLVRAFRLHRLLPRGMRSRWLLPGERETTEIVDGWLPGAALVARREAVAEVGPLDQSLFIYGEDREWCGRMSRAGWSIGLCADIAFVHGHGTSTRATWDEGERTRREVAGQIGAARLMHGSLWARAFALLAGLILLTESINPAGKDRRAGRRLRGRAYLRCALGRPTADPRPRGGNRGAPR